MNKLNTGLVAAFGIATGLLTLRALRRRRRNAEVVSPIDEARSEAELAVEDVKNAGKHARAAGDNVVTYAKTKKAQLATPVE